MRRETKWWAVTGALLGYSWPQRHLEGYASILVATLMCTAFAAAVCGLSAKLLRRKDRTRWLPYEVAGDPKSAVFTLLIGLMLLLKAVIPAAAFLLIIGAVPIWMMSKPVSAPADGA